MQIVKTSTVAHKGTWIKMEGNSCKPEKPWTNKPKVERGEQCHSESPVALGRASRSSRVGRTQTQAIWVYYQHMDLALGPGTVNSCFSAQLWAASLPNSLYLHPASWFTLLTAVALPQYTQCDLYKSLLKYITSWHKFFLNERAQTQHTCTYLHLSFHICLILLHLNTMARGVSVYPCALFVQPWHGVENPNRCRRRRSKSKNGAFQSHWSQGGETIPIMAGPDMIGGSWFWFLTRTQNGPPLALSSHRSLTTTLSCLHTFRL